MITLYIYSMFTTCKCVSKGKKKSILYIHAFVYIRAKCVYIQICFVYIHTTFAYRRVVYTRVHIGALYIHAFFCIYTLLNLYIHKNRCVYMWNVCFYIYRPKSTYSHICIETKMRIYTTFSDDIYTILFCIYTTFFCVYTFYTSCVYTNEIDIYTM